MTDKKAKEGLFNMSSKAIIKSANKLKSDTEALRDFYDGKIDSKELKRRGVKFSRPIKSL